MGRWKRGPRRTPLSFFARCRYGSHDRHRTARMNGFWSYWYFHLPNFVLAAVMYTVIGRLVLGFFVPENWDNFIWRGFRFVTDPAVRAVRYVTPACAGPAGRADFRGALADGAAAWLFRDALQRRACTRRSAGKLTHGTHRLGSGHGDRHRQRHLLALGACALCALPGLVPVLGAADDASSSTWRARSSCRR